VDVLHTFDEMSLAKNKIDLFGFFDLDGNELHKPLLMGIKKAGVAHPAF
jgi:hypothetical protein